MIKKEKKSLLNTSKNLTDKQKFNDNLKPFEPISEYQELKKTDNFGATRGWNYGIPGWYVEHY